MNGITTELTWPHTVVRHGTDESGHDMLFLVGPEPDFHWRAFTDAVVGLARSWRRAHGGRPGRLPCSGAPHPAGAAGGHRAPGSADLIERVGVVQGELEVPAGVIGGAGAGVRSGGNPDGQPVGPGAALRGGHALPRGQRGARRGPGHWSGSRLDSSALRRAADSSRRQVDQLIADNGEHQAMVRKLEESIDASEGNAMGVDAVPSGDEIAAELERFLRGEDQQ